ncbi:MAG TPA: DUF1570 domain-containing protein [Phycisphaerae bacterium]|nr:DUF1570 domain-containing protein [Phycisphaerae bacterium]
MLSKGRVFFPAVSLALVGASSLWLGGCRQSEPAKQAVQSQVTDWQFGRALGQRLLTDHFAVYTTVQDALTLELLPVFMETAYRQYISMAPAPDDSDRRLPIYLFDTRNQWEQFTRGFARDEARRYLQIRSGGYTRQETCVAYYIRRELTLAVLAHEGFHQYAYRHFGKAVPAWLNEGLASYCENYAWDGDQPVFAPHANRFRINHLRQALVTGKLMPLAEILDAHAGDVVTTTQRKVQTYYAQVWSMTMFLQHGPQQRYTWGFARLLAELGTPALAATARAQRAATGDRDIGFGQAVFRAYITEDLNEFTERYLAYLRELTGLNVARHPTPTHSTAGQTALALSH